MKTYLQHLKETAKDVFIDAPVYFYECLRGHHRDEIASVTLVIAGLLILVSWIVSPVIVPVAAGLDYIRQGDEE